MQVYKLYIFRISANAINKAQLLQMIANLTHTAILIKYTIFKK